VKGSLPRRRLTNERVSRDPVAGDAEPFRQHEADRDYLYTRDAVATGTAPDEERKELLDGYASIRWKKCGGGWSFWLRHQQRRGSGNVSGSSLR